MARSVTRDYGFGSDVPNPIGAETFDAEQEAIKRHRLELAAMLKQDPNASGWGGVVGQAIKELGGYYSEGELNKRERSLAQRRSAAAQDWLNRRPPDTPAQDEIVGTGPLAPPPGTPGVDDAPPPAPAGEADVMPQPSANNMTADTPALWVGKDSMDMVPRGVTGADFKA